MSLVLIHVGTRLITMDTERWPCDTMWCYFACLFVYWFTCYTDLFFFLTISFLPPLDHQPSRVPLPTCSHTCDGDLSATGSSIHSHEIINHIRHSRPLPGILMPHPLHQGNRFNTPMFLQSSGSGSSMFRTNCIIDVMFIMSFPWVFLPVNLFLRNNVWDGKKEDSLSHQSSQTSFPRKPSQPRKRRLCNHKMA
jgi:hypothetical protein